MGNNGNKLDEKKEKAKKLAKFLYKVADLVRHNPELAKRIEDVPELKDVKMFRVLRAYSKDGFKEYKQDIFEIEKVVEIAKLITFNSGPKKSD